MSSVKLLVAFLIVAVSLECYQAVTIEELHNSTLDAINKFLEDTNAAVQDACQRNIRLVNEVDGAINSGIDAIKGQIKNAMNQVKQNIRTSVNESRGVIGKISNCTEQHDADLTDWQSALLNDSIGCISEKITVAKNSIVNLLNSTADLSRIALTANKRIESRCSTPNFQDFFGLLGYSFCVTQTITELNGEVTNDLFGITVNGAALVSIASSLSNFPADIATCLATRTGARIPSSVPIVGKIVQCTLMP